ncbi:Palmitoyltransferase [Spironucleus salmonicida]|uniref:Palmitoyltransferase n=1 Tax=Spironucleus salmonicida TaxID=348837 RepID=V6LXM3_9EUKA|nr:Palmitoyltransferase [Spironucleus salmonicida]|eukprot:EST48466.1 DHHC zinc finger and transmembrane domain-containing protein [Spironucleus salmonicida]
MRGNVFDGYSTQQKLLRTYPIISFIIIGLTIMIINGYFLRSLQIYIIVILLLISCYMFCNIVYTVFQLNFYDPGYVQILHEEAQKDDETLFCVLCDSSRPPRSHHCKTCNRCVLAMDHHCYVFNTCISHYSYGYFIKFLFCAGLFLIYSSWLVIPGLIFAIKNARVDVRYLIEAIITVIIVFFVNIFGISVMSLIFGMGWFPICKGKTTIDILQKHPGTQQSVKDNLREYLGRNYFLRFLVIGIKMQ